MKSLRTFLATNAPATVILIRLAVGAIFLSEGIQKFLFPADLGAGRFAKLGIPDADFFGPFVGFFEILCGSLILLGLFTRMAAIPLFIIIITAIVTTKIATLSEKGFWVTAHEGRTDYAMFLAILFLLIAGGGVWSLDARLFQKFNKSS
jgi:putative oxidoreductase